MFMAAIFLLTRMNGFLLSCFERKAAGRERDKEGGSIICRIGSVSVVVLDSFLFVIVDVQGNIYVSFFLRCPRHRITLL